MFLSKKTPALDVATPRIDAVVPAHTNTATFALG